MGDWNWRQLRNAPPTWSDLYRLSHIPMLRYPLMFLVVVPFVVKSIIFLKNRKILTTEIPLPIAVELLFVSAVATILAALVYTFRCPRLVKDYLEYGDFEKTKKGPKNLADEFAADIGRAPLLQRGLRIICGRYRRTTGQLRLTKTHSKRLKLIQYRAWKQRGVLRLLPRIYLMHSGRCETLSMTYVQPAAMCISDFCLSQ